MPEHSLHPGLEVIDAIAYLGECLGYEIERERSVGGGGAAVDLAWYAAGDRGIPLMIFEVESKASSGMANNAMKVLSRDVDDFVKPLFLFHVVLKGGETNERIANLRRQWGSHNYRVYVLSKKGEVQRLVSDVLSQHRRITASVDLQQVHESLKSRAFSSVDHLSIFRKIEHLGFSANYLGGYARIGLSNPELLDLYLATLESAYIERSKVLGEYGGVIGDYIPGLIELALLIAASRMPDSQGPEKFEEWQEASGYGLRTIGAHFGLSRHYDSFVIGVAPYVYAMAGMLLRDKSESFCWLVSDLHSIIAAEYRQKLSDAAIFPGAIWLLQLAASGLKLHSSREGQSVDALHSYYEFARKVLNKRGGVPAKILDSPPDYINIQDDDSGWLERLNDDPIEIPDWESLNARYCAVGDTLEIQCEDALSASIALLLSAGWHSQSNYHFLCELRKTP